jgi:hypothetical protein
MLYEAFDNFLNTGTWHTIHPNDEERFFVALEKVIKDSKFNPDQLGEYMRQKNTSRAMMDRSKSRRKHR